MQFVVSSSFLNKLLYLCMHWLFIASDKVRGFAVRLSSTYKAHACLHVHLNAPTSFDKYDLRTATRLIHFYYKTFI